MPQWHLVAPVMGYDGNKMAMPQSAWWSSKYVRISYSEQFVLWRASLSACKYNKLENASFSHTLSRVQATPSWELFLAALALRCCASQHVGGYCAALALIWQIKPLKSISILLIISSPCCCRSSETQVVVACERTIVSMIQSFGGISSCLCEPLARIVEVDK